MSDIKFKKYWAMPNKWTFQIRPIKFILMKYNFQNWVDPFAVQNSPCLITNDLNPENNTKFHMDALDFLKSLETEKYDGVLYDPPYSLRQASECYKGFGNNKFTGRMDYWANCKNEIARIIKPGGTAICFGWNSNGEGKGRGFIMQKIYLIAHGGGKNDTIITIETKGA
jgi:hypothetical protein